MNSLISLAQSPSALKIREEAMLTAIEALEENNNQKLEEAILNWEQNSGENEELFRLQLLQSIGSRTFADSLYDSNIIGLLLAFEKGESQSLPPYYHAPSYARVDVLTKRFDQKINEAFVELAVIKDLNQLESALVEHYLAKFSIWEKLDNHDLDGFAIQEYYDSIISNVRYHNDAITIQAGTNFTLAKSGMKTGTEFGLGYALMNEKMLFKAAFGFRFMDTNNLQFVVNGAEVEIKDEQFLFANLGFGYLIKSANFADIFATFDLSFRTQNYLYLSYYTLLNEPVYRETMQGNGYFAPGLALKKDFEGSYFLLETKYFTSMNKQLAESRSADQLVVSLMYALRFREKIKKSHFK